MSNSGALFVPSTKHGFDARAFELLNALDHGVEPKRVYHGLGRQAWLGVRFDGAGF